MARGRSGGQARGAGGDHDAAAKNRPLVEDIRLLGRIDGGSNYVSQDENSAHFGLGAATTVDELRVEWTNGLVTTASNVAANQTLILTPNGCIMAADVNRDYSVDFGDLNAILGRWGQSGDLPEDTDGDGSVNFGDLNRVLGAWGDQCP